MNNLDEEKMVQFNKLVLEWGTLYSQSQDYLHDDKLAEASKTLGVFCWNNSELTRIIKISSVIEE
jgi:hypothetical protein